MWRQKLYDSYISHYAHAGQSPLSRENLFFTKPVFNAYYKKHLPPAREVPILEIGCGNGIFLAWLKELGYTNLTGIETSKEQIEEAQKSTLLEGVRIFKGDAKEFLAHTVVQYVCVIARDVLEHFDKPEVLEIAELLKKALATGGTCILQTPNAESPFGSRARYCDFTHGVSFTSRSIRQVLLATGFTGASSYPSGPVAHGIVSGMRVVLWKLIELLLRVYLLIETGSGRGIFTQNIITVAR